MAYASSSTTNTPRRPAMIAELAEQARDNDWDESGSIKYYLRLAEQYRHDGKGFLEQSDLESAFVAYARAASLVLEKVPNVRGYDTKLSSAQRNNLSLNGQEILDNLGKLKPILLERYESWAARHPNGDLTPIAPQQRQPEPDHTQNIARDMDRLTMDSREGERRVKEELEKWKKQREDMLRKQEEDRFQTSGQTPGSLADIRRESAVSAAKLASGVPVNPHNQSTNGYSQVNGSGQRPTQVMSPVRHQDAQRDRGVPYQREDGFDRRRPPEENYRQQHTGAVNRQQESESNGYSERNRFVSSSRVPSADPIHPTSSIVSTPTPSLSSTSSAFPQPSYGTTEPHPSSSATLRAPTAVRSRPPSFLGQYSNGTEIPFVMPLESPTKYDGDSTDSEAVSNPLSDWRRNKHHSANEVHRTPTRPPVRSPSYPPPITTTSPPPSEGSRIQYPSLMSQHQLDQGYRPSLNSMFEPGIGQAIIPSSLLFEAGSKSQQPAYNGQAVYSSNMLPQPSRPDHHSHHSHSRHQPNSHHAHPQQSQETSYLHPQRPAPIAPTNSQGVPQPNRASASRTPSSRPEPVPGELKHVNLPRDCLPRFLAIAKVNTSMNRETCGLLLGKDKGHKFVVSTLLIPRQHSTSDTCTMDEEELVLQFTEERSLITLGWIHTHPSQSCFMSSVDLHTHSGFQRMLPESFAVVCAPKSTPNFGIFRLTDPPGLQAILQCTAKEAFHPHGDIPIYTDADKGHVQMKDIALEIVDLR